MPDNIASGCRVDAISHESTEATRPEDESDGHDNGRNPMKSSAEEIVLGREALIHKVTIKF